jgi:hypothetical protein
MKLLTSIHLSSMNMTDNSKLCKVCQSVISTADLKVALTDFTLGGSNFRADDEIIYPHHANVQDLHESAQVGCPLCAILWDFFSNPLHSLKQKGDRDHGQASFTFSVNYRKIEEHLWHADDVSYLFRMVYNDSQLRGNSKHAIEIRAIGVESKFILKRYGSLSTLSYCSQNHYYLLFVASTSQFAAFLLGLIR